jgi:peptidoglycan/xylan/chitin deacetylase (PgdA/CDA1 family)
MLKTVYPGCVWRGDKERKIIHLTFDDGPHPEATPFVLELLSAFNAKATFFCIGKNVVQYPDIYRRLISEGHAIGNHTHDHLNGWKVTDQQYFENILLASKHIDSKLFRPPYGRISGFQVRHLKAEPLRYKIIMWDVLSGDFDTTLSPGQCNFNVVRNARNGSIVVFHDSEKAFQRLKVALPGCLKFFSEKGYSFEKLTYDGALS